MIPERMRRISISERISTFSLEEAEGLKKTL
jgi:hypothetical protein